MHNLHVYLVGMRVRQHQYVHPVGIWLKMSLGKVLRVFAIEGNGYLGCSGLPGMSILGALGCPEIGSQMFRAEYLGRSGLPGLGMLSVPGCPE